MEKIISNIYYTCLKRIRKLEKNAFISLKADIQTPYNLTLGESSRIEKYVSISAPGKTYIDIGKNCKVRDFSILQTLGQGFIKIGNNTTVNPFCILYGFGGLNIGSNVMIAAQVMIITAEHNTSNSNTPMCQQGASGKGITIEDNVWIGAGAKILDGVTLGEGAVVGAGAVVTKSVPKNTVVVGVPAKVIKTRT